MDAKTVEWVIGQGIGAVLALVMFLIYRKDVKNGLHQWKTQTELLVSLTREQTEAVTGMSDRIDEMTRALPNTCPIRVQQAHDRAVAQQAALHQPGS